METREIDRSGDVPCQWCHGRGCLVCLEARAKRAKDIVLHIRCTGAQLDTVLEKINGNVLRTTQVLVYASYEKRFIEASEADEERENHAACAGDDPPCIRAMKRELQQLRERTQTSFILDRAAEIERKLAEHQASAESFQRLWEASPPPAPEPEPPETPKKTRKRRRALTSDV